MTWLHTFSGREVSILDPKPEQFALEDIAHALSMQCRYNGHSRYFYSIAEHSLLVARALREQGCGIEVQRVGLMHDATEAYVGDLVAPIKMLPGFAVFKTLEDILWKEGIQPAFELEDIGAEVKRADLRALATEAPQVMTWPPPRDWELPSEATPWPDVWLDFLEPAEAELLFLRECIELGIRAVSR